MNTTYSIFVAFVLSMGDSLCGWAANPCMPIAKACMQAGYYKEGNTEGKGLIENCVMPIVAHKNPLKNVTFGDDVLKQCGVTLKEKMQQH